MGTRFEIPETLKKLNQTEDNNLNSQEINNQISSSNVGANNSMLMNGISNPILRQASLSTTNTNSLNLNNNVIKTEDKLVEPPIQNYKTELRPELENNTISVSGSEPTIEEKESLHVKFGNNLIDILHLKSFSDTLVGYSGSKYSVVTDKFIKSCIIKRYKKATPSLCNSTIYYIRGILYNEDIELQVDTDYINFKNGLLDLNNNKFVPHTPDIFTINQLNVNYIEDFKEDNEDVNKYLDDISNHNQDREDALLQIIGYSMTTRNNIQKFIIFYGPTASNGKSTLVDIINAIIGNENISHKDLKTFEQRFGANGIQFKQLNIVAEMSQKRIKDTSVFKSTISGDTFESDVKFQDSTNITTYVKHIFTANELPPVDDKTDGFYRKVNLLLFDNKFDVKTSTFNVDKFKTQENLDYLANLAIRKYLKMVNSGSLEFANQEESDKLLSAYKKENDTVIAFLTADVSVETIYGNSIRRDFVFKMYREFCSLNELKPIGKQSFYRELREKYNFIEKPMFNHTEIHFYREKPIEKNDINEN